MREGIHFSYDGIKSVDMGLLNVIVDGGMFEESFLPSREIEEKTISGNDKPYFQKVRLEPLSFNLTFAFEYSYDEKKIREVARWLNQSYYKPFYTIDNPNRIFYCMLDGESNLVHNGLKQGYITLTFRCDSPYSYTPTFNKTNMIFYNTKQVKTISENTFNSEIGVQNNIKINQDGHMEIDQTVVTWNTLFGKKWSDL